MLHPERLVVVCKKNFQARKTTSTGNRLSNPDLLSPAWEPEPDRITRLVVGCPSPSLIRLVMRKKHRRLRILSMTSRLETKRELSIYINRQSLCTEYMRHAHQIHGGRAYLQLAHPSRRPLLLFPKSIINSPKPATSRRLPSTPAPITPPAKPPV